MDFFEGVEPEEGLRLLSRTGARLNFTYTPAEQALEIAVVAGANELHVNDERDPVEAVALRLTGPAAAELWAKLQRRSGA
ncbi:MAG TPA: hypothetical protein VFS21_29735 [Roseiflexaceae bacterium]|nr:hypothetical protein [Roseiflexaceae bacterium]